MSFTVGTIRFDPAVNFVSVPRTDASPDSCAPLTYTSPVAYDLLFAVCDCVANGAGCFQMDGANPVRTFTNATATECGPSRSRIGPGIFCPCTTCSCHLIRLR